MAGSTTNAPTPEIPLSLAVNTKRPPGSIVILSGAPNPDENGEPATWVSTPLERSMVNAEMSWEIQLATYTWVPVGSTTTESESEPVVNGEPVTGVKAPDCGSTEYTATPPGVTLIDMKANRPAGSRAIESLLLDAAGEANGEPTIAVNAPVARLML